MLYSFINALTKPVILRGHALNGRNGPIVSGKRKS
jgi:hypothetical protein